MAIKKHTHDCGCVVTVYGDESAPPDVEYCDDHLPTTGIFDLILDGGDGNKLKAVELIRELSPEQKRDLRAACQDLDNLIDDVWLEQLREKRRGK